jgi:tetratricopeptide (TPR) repeat protein
MKRLLYASAALLLPVAFRGQTPKPPESFDQLAARARAAMEAERAPEAIGLFERATQLRPQWTEGWWYLGALLYDVGRFEGAREAFGQFVKLERQQPGPGFAMLGLSAFQLKRYEEALAALERGSQLGLGPNPVFRRSVLYHVGILENLLGQPELAVKRLTLAANYIAAAHPEAPQQAVLADRELVDALGMGALRIPKLPADLPPSQAGMVRLAGRAQALIAMQDRVAADLEFRQLLALYPAEPGVHYFYGVFLLKEHPELASAEFHKELEISPNNAAARIQIAFERLNAADYETGLKYAQEAIALVPKDFAVHVVCGRLWLGLRKTDRALEELQTAVKLEPDSPDAHFALSRALAQAGRNEEAARERAEFERLRAEVDAADKRSGL